MRSTNKEMELKKSAGCEASVSSDSLGRCFACDKPLKMPYRVCTIDGQEPYVGSDCYKKIKRAGENGYQPIKKGPLLGPRLFLHRPNDETKAQGDREK